MPISCPVDEKLTKAPSCSMELMRPSNAGSRRRRAPCLGVWEDTSGTPNTPSDEWNAQSWSSRCLGMK